MSTIASSAPLLGEDLFDAARRVADTTRAELREAQRSLAALSIEAEMGRERLPRQLGARHTASAGRAGNGGRKVVGEG